MGNRVNFQTTKFVNLDNDLNEQEPAYGYRVYDDYESAYNNCYSKEELPRTAAEALEILKWHDGLYESALEKGGFFFNDDYIQLDDEGNVVEERAG